MGEKFKKFSKYFGGEYMKYWYIAFAITVLLMLAFSELRARSANSRSIVPEKIF